MVPCCSQVRRKVMINMLFLLSCCSVFCDFIYYLFMRPLPFYYSRQALCVYVCVYVVLWLCTLLFRTEPKICANKIQKEMSNAMTMPGTSYVNSFSVLFLLVIAFCSSYAFQSAG